MALTKEFEYDCEVRGPYKAVQVRVATIVKDDGTEISVHITGTSCTAAPSRAILGAIPTSAVKTHLYKQCATPCGLAQSSLPMRHLQTHKHLPNGE